MALVNVTHYVQLFEEHSHYPGSQGHVPSTMNYDFLPCSVSRHPLCQKTIVLAEVARIVRYFDAFIRCYI